jgi:hypothetical protein
MKSLFFSVAAAAILVAATASVAGTLTGEVRIGDIDGNPGSTEYRVDYGDTYHNVVMYGGEITVKQNQNEGGLSSKIVGRVGPVLPVVLGFKPKVYGEFGESVSQGNNTEFWGTYAGVSHPVYGPVSVNVGYRHREGLRQDVSFNENRLSTGLTYNLGKSNTLGVEYYRTSGTTTSDVIGISASHSF